MGGSIDECMDGQLVGWLGGRMGAYIDGSIRVDRLMGGWIYGQKNRSTDKSMAR